MLRRSVRFSAGIDSRGGPSVDAYAAGERRRAPAPLREAQAPGPNSDPGDAGHGWLALRARRLAAAGLMRNAPERAERGRRNRVPHGPCASSRTVSPHPLTTGSGIETRRLPEALRILAVAHPALVVMGKPQSCGERAMAAAAIAAGVPCLTAMGSPLNLNLCVSTHMEPCVPIGGVVQFLLRDLRQEASMRPIDVAHKLSEYQSFVSKYESGERQLDAIELRLICRALGTTLEEFARRLEDRIARLEVR
jgi:hypothetical protein